MYFMQPHLQSFFDINWDELKYAIMNLKGFAETSRINYKRKVRIFKFAFRSLRNTLRKILVDISLKN